MRAVGIIPARYDSSRFPGKALAILLDKPMVCWVAEGASSSCALERVIIATDDERIIEAAVSCGYDAVLTSPDHQSGSDRVWEVAQGLDAEIVVNIQGDEPTITADVVEACVDPFSGRTDIDVVTLRRPIDLLDDLLNPNVVKVVTDNEGFALYFSRAPILHPGENCERFGKASHYRHLGIYAYRRKALERFCKLPQAVAEREEKLEQLRGLAAGMRYYVVETDYLSVDVNTPSDLRRAEEILRRRVEESE